MNKVIEYIKNNKLFVSLFVFLVLGLLVIHGLLPNMVGSGTVAGRFMILGFMECGSQSLRQLAELKCAAVGGDSGGLMPTGSPVYIFGALLIKIFGFNAEWALMIVGLTVMTAALWGIYKLIAKFGVSRYLALLMGFLYLITVGVMSMQSFGGTYWGYLLLPLAIYLVTVFIDKIDIKNKKNLVAITAAWSAMSTLQLFIDGYSFFITFAVAGIFILINYWRKWLVAKALWTYGIFIAATVIAYGLYTTLVPGTSSWSHSETDLVRAMGLDLSTMFRPSSGIWWAKLSGFKVEASKLWGDGSNSAYNYVGFSVIILAGLGVYSSFKSKKKGATKNKKLVWMLLAAAAVSFVLSMGPSVKWNAQRPVIEGGVISHSSYLMPSEEALIDLPTSIFITKAPGLSSMRAIYRWHFLTQLVLIILAAIGIQYIIDKKSYKWGIPLVVLVFLELSPNPYTFYKLGLKKGEQINKFDSQVIEPLNEGLHDNELVIFYPNAQGGNDYLANYIAPHTQIRTYNVGNDKAVVYAKSSRPKEVLQLLDFNDTNRSVQDEQLVVDVLNKDIVDAVVVPYFDLRWNSYAWPPRTQAGIVRGRDFVNRLQDNKEVKIELYDNFAIVRD